MRNPFASRPLTRGRIALAIANAGAADALQIALGPVGWTFLDEIIDVVTMFAISLLIGFHPLLLPTFIVEIFPIVDMLPTWTGCVGAIILWRKNMDTPRSQTRVDHQDEPAAAPSPTTEPKGPVIDV